MSRSYILEVLIWVDAPLFSESEYMHEEFPSPVEKFSKMHDSSLHKVQLMKASFYVHDDVSG